MSQYYNAKKTKNLYQVGASSLFRLSRSKLELFLNCPRCFYMDRRLGVAQPPGFPFNLNSAVDFLLKKEFDLHRAKGTAHPLMEHYKVKAVPFSHEKMDIWRENFTGVSVIHKPTKFEVFGAVDDIWVNDAGELIVVDYKSTAKDGEITLDAQWQDGYKRQMEIYQWLLRGNGFKVSNTGYFVYCNGKRDKKAFDGKLEFDIKLIPYTGNDGWVEKALIKAYECLQGSLPPYGADCDFCNYRQAANKAEQEGSSINVEVMPKVLEPKKYARVKKEQGQTLFG